ncbi:hypothetical protein DSUL_20585 [Desulfovibrionales bacterium]
MPPLRHIQKRPMFYQILIERRIFLLGSNKTFFY